MQLTAQKQTGHSDHLDCPVKRCTGKGVGVFGIEDNLHDVVRVPLKDLSACPSLYNRKLRTKLIIVSQSMALKDSRTHSLLNNTLYNSTLMHEGMHFQHSGNRMLYSNTDASLMACWRCTGPLA